MKFRATSILRAGRRYLGDHGDRDIIQNNILFFCFRLARAAFQVATRLAELRAAGFQPPTKDNGRTMKRCTRPLVRITSAYRGSLPRAALLRALIRHLAEKGRLVGVKELLAAT